MAQCPHMAKTAATANQRWWPNQLNLKILNGTPAPKSDTSKAMYKKDFLSLNLKDVKADIAKVLTTSHPMWPADYGHYGPFMIRMAWHSAGTYRTFDGRGGANSGNLRFAPLNSWPDNGNLDKAKRLLWPVKQKYGRKISWADLMILTGNVALESMGFKTFGFAGGRVDIYGPEEDVYWGQEETWLGDETRYKASTETERVLEKPLGAVQMGLIYVNPEGPGGNPDPLLAAKDIRDTFGRMAMNDEETVALIAGGHTFGKCHGAGDAALVGPEPEGAPIEQQGLGWKCAHGTGKGGDTITSGLEGAWTKEPAKWDNGYFANLFGYEWVLTKSPAGANQWTPKEAEAQGTVPDAHDPKKRHAPFMLTTDLALRFDPIYGPISKRYQENPEEFAEAFAKAWFKLTHRDMGPLPRYLGSEVPSETLLWQDAVPDRGSYDLTADQIATLKSQILACDNVSTAEWVRVAWGSASTFRRTDYRGGANGARIRLAPQSTWAANKPDELAKVLAALEGIQSSFDGTVSMADLIVLAGSAAIEAAAKKGGYENVTVPFSPGRTDATLEQTDVPSFDVLEPVRDGFRNYLANSDGGSPEDWLVDKSQMLGLSAAEMTVLVGGLRALGTSHDITIGTLTKEPGTLNNAFFTNLLDINTEWVKVNDNLFEGKSITDGTVLWKATRVDLIFGAESRLRALSEYYGCSDSGDVFVADFVNAWVKVMNADRFDLEGDAAPTSKL